ncbi:MAG: hypothetical protein KKC23_07290, partial [Proteobacteria bacterium]|nr:hypothetical protein [Pseudomonadota bacterium]
MKNSLGPPLTNTRTLGALGGIIASRIAREFRFGGPSFAVSCEEASGLKALEIGVRSLQQNETDAVLVAYLWLGERLEGLQMLGGLGVLFAVFL